ncbi:MAG: protein phosphatase 2C domain-containing protein [Desulfohalobiaceae bacterium]
MLINALQTPIASKARNEHDLAQLLLQAGSSIRRKAEAEPELEGMGTTGTIALICRATLFWAHVGDSRLYLARQERLMQISRDHTFIQDLLDDGTLSHEKAREHPLRNMLDQCVGCGSLQPDSGRISLQARDKLLLCSDGLTLHVLEQEIQNSLQSESARQTAEDLLNLALQAGGRDNITVLVVFTP